MARPKSDKRSEAAAPRLASAAAVMNALRTRYASPSGAWALLECVANGTGSRADRWADAVAMSVWPSRGLEIHGFEIKVSRSDLLREIKDPHKAEAVASYCDFWWVAVGDAAIAKASELPPAWGLLVPKAAATKADKDGVTMVIAKDAKQLEPKAIDRGFLAAILRRAAERYDVGKIEQNVRNEIYRQVHADVGAQVAESHQREIASMQLRLDVMQKRLDEAKANLEMVASADFDKRMLGEAIALVALLTRWPNAEHVIGRALDDLRGGINCVESIRQTLEQSKRIVAVLAGKQELGSLEDDPCPRLPSVAG